MVRLNKIGRDEIVFDTIRDSKIFGEATKISIFKHKGFRKIYSTDLLGLMDEVALRKDKEKNNSLRRFFTNLTTFLYIEGSKLKTKESRNFLINLTKFIKNNTP